MKLAVIIVDSEQLKSQNKIFSAILSKVDSVLQKKETIILYNSSEQNQIKSKQADEKSTTHYVHEGQFMWFVWALVQTKFVDDQLISKLITYVLLNQDHQNLRMISQRSLEHFVKFMCHSKFQIRLIDFNIIGILMSDKPLQNKYYNQLLSYCYFFSKLIRDRKEYLAKNINNLTNEVSNAIILNLKKQQQFLWATVENFLNRHDKHVSKIRSPEKKDTSIEAQPKEKFNEMNNRALSKFSSQIMMNLSKNQFFIEKIWVKLLSSISDDSNDAEIIMDLTKTLRALCQLKKQEIPKTLYEAIVIKHIKIIKKRLDKIYPTVIPSLQKCINASMPTNLLDEEISAKVNQNKSDQDIMADKAKQTLQESSLFAKKKNHTSGVIQGIEKNQNVQKTSDLIHSKNTQQQYVKILKSQLDLMKQELQFFRSIKQKFMEFDKIKPPNSESINQSNSIVETKVKSHFQEKRKSIVETKQSPKLETQEKSTRNKGFNQKKRQFAKEKMKTTNEKKSEKVISQSKDVVSSDHNDNDFKISESQLDVEMMNQEQNRYVKIQEGIKDREPNTYEFKNKPKTSIWLEKAKKTKRSSRSLL